MNLLRSLRLVGIHNKQFFLKLRYDLGRELVVLISSLVLLGLFAYIFRDFLGDKLKVIPPAEQAGIARGFALILLMVVGTWVASPLSRLWKEEPGLRSFALRSGETKSTVTLFLYLQTLVILLVVFGIYWNFVGSTYGRWSVATALGLQVLSLALAALRFFLLGNRKENEAKFRPLLDDRTSSRLKTMTLWRSRQILLRNRLGKLCLGIALAIGLISALLLAKGAPFALAVLLSMASGLFAAAALSFQLEEDMRAIWFERQIAGSHDEYVAVYQRISLLLAVGLGVLVCLAAFAARGLTAPFETLKLGAIAGLFPYLFPAVMFQIAPERPVLQIMTIALIGLFLGTAVFAHWASIIVLPIAMVYAKQYQRNNFYRS